MTFDPAMSEVLLHNPLQHDHLVVLDDVEGLNVGDIVSGNAGIPGGTTIQSIDSGTKTITLSANLTAGIAASTNTALQILTFTQGADDNKDRGIEFKYFNGSLKQGFFGYDESYGIICI